MVTAELRELARLYSIETSYTDAAGNKHSADRDAIVAAVEKRAGAPVAEALERRRAELAERVIEPVSVAWGSAKPEIAVRLQPWSRVEWELELEDGSWRSGRAEVVDNRIALDASLPHGYHTIRIAGHEALIIAAPAQAHAPRAKTWGLFTPLYAAHTRRSWGAGDLGDLLSYASWVDHHGGGVVATLPMLAALDDEPSPYSPVSRLFWNEMYLDVTRLPEYDESDVDLGAIAHLRQGRQVDHAAVRREKRRVLERCAERFTGGEELARFAAHARGYAEFRARAAGGDADAIETKTRYHLYVQYRLAQQMREMANAARRLGAGLYLDFPLGVNPGGYDAWRFADLFAKDVSVGAPPDAFFTKGQNWGFPPFDPDAIRAEGYQYFRDAIRHHVSHAGILRIDHVMGLHRLYWIPEGADAKSGVYVRYAADELYAIVVLESRRHECVVIGEDLGTVPDEVPEMMNRHGLRRMYVVQYEIKPESPPLYEPPRASIASINTHDMPTFAGFWSGRDIDERVEQDLLDEEGARSERDTRETMRRELIAMLVEDGFLTSGPTKDTAQVLEALLAFLASSEAEIVLLNIEDLWQEREPQNMPGLPDRSWRQRLRLSLEDAQADGSIRRILEKVDAGRARGLLRDKSEAAVRVPQISSKEG